MKLTKENVYIDLRGKSKEELTELYLLLKNNNEEILINGLDVFVGCYLNLKNNNYNFHFYCNCWSLAYSSVDIYKQEITIQQLKEILQPMETFTPIAMKCTQEQFNAVKPKLIGLKIIGLDSFTDCNYLVNNLGKREKLISNITPDSKGYYNREIHEEWNEEIFLKACGIKTEPTLIERLQKAEAEVKRLKEAIEDGKIKVNDWVIVNEEKLIFKASDYDVQFLGNIHKKITNPELIKLLEQEIK